MTTKLAEFVFSPWLTPVRLVSTSNIAGTYYNGPNNNGVGATYTIAASSLTIDSVVCVVGDRVLLQTQTATYTQGIYIVESIGSTVVLQRADDQQSLEQIQTGQYVSVKGGSINAGSFFTVIEPRPQNIGVDAIVFSADPASGAAVTFSGGPSAANALAVFSGTSGNLKPQTTTSTLAYGLTAASGNIQAAAGNVIAGASGAAGNLQSFPATGSKGSFIVAGVANTGNTNTTLSNDAMGQTSTINIPDPVNAIGQLLVGATATPFVSGNFPQNSGTAGLMVDSGIAVSSLATTTTAVLLSPAGNQTITAHNLTVAAGNITAGASGAAGTLTSFPSVASEGSLIVAAVSNAGGNFSTTISNAASIAQNQVVSIPDGGNATSNFIISKSGGTQHITTGGLEVDAGAISSGISTGGFVGVMTAYPTTATSGFIAMQGAVNGSGNFGTTLSNQTTQAQSTVLTFPDVGATTGRVLAAGAALVSGNFVQASGVAGAVVDSGVSAVAGGAIGIPYTAIVTMTAAQVNAAYTTPFQIVAAPTASQTIMVLNAQVITEVSTAFTSGGVAQIQYGNTNHAGGTIATSATIATAEITAATSQIFTMAPIAAATVMATASFKGLGLFFTNATQVFATGTGSTVTIAVTYMVIPTT